MTPPVVIPIDPEDRPAWLAQRRKGIGSSDVGPLLGMSPFATPYSLWVEKTEELPEQEDTDALRWGRRLEAVIADEFAERHPMLDLWKPNVMYAHADRPYMQANPDRLILRGDDEPDALVEIKSSNWTEDWENGPPDHVLLQVQHQLAVMDLPRAWIALLMFGREYREWLIERDEATIALLLDLEADFWRRVTEMDPPPVDGDEATVDALKALYHDPDDEAVEGGDRAAALLRHRKDLKFRGKELETELNRCENELRVIFGNRTRMLVGGEPAASWSIVNSARVDMEKLEAEHPDLVASYRKQSSYRRLSVRKAFG